MIFILAQLCGIIALILTVISVQFKTKEKIVMCSVFANIVSECDGLAQLCLGPVDYRAIQ